MDAYTVRSLPRTTSLLVTGASSMGGWVGGERAAILESAGGSTARGQPPQGAALQWEEARSG